MFNISYFQSDSLLQCTDSVISLESKLGELGIYMYVNVLPSCMFIYNEKKVSGWSALSIEFLYQYHCVHSKRGFYFYWIWHMTQQFIYKWYTSVSGISENLYRLFTWRLWKQTAFLCFDPVPCRLREFRQTDQSGICTSFRLSFNWSQFLQIIEQGAL